MEIKQETINVGSLVKYPAVKIGKGFPGAGLVIAIHNEDMFNDGDVCQICKILPLKSDTAIFRILSSLERVL